VKCLDTSPEEGAADARRNGTPEPIVSALVELWQNTRANRSAFHTDTARKLLGRPLMTFEQWCLAYVPKL
jgi:hypothetical protein